MLAQRLVPALQVCPHDIDAGIDLAGILGEIGDNRQDREFWIVQRADTDTRKVAQAKALIDRKFHCKTFIARTNLDGWPAGSNALWYSTMIEAWHQVRSGFTAADGIFTFEADCIPLRTDWFEVLEQEWIRKGKLVVGHVHGDHINGNAMFNMRLLESQTRIRWTSYENVGWDWLNRDIFMAIGCDTHLIWQRYKCGHLSDAAFLGIKKHGQRPAILHGIKGPTARTVARKYLCV